MGLLDFLDGSSSGGLFAAQPQGQSGAGMRIDPRMMMLANMGAAMSAASAPRYGPPVGFGQVLGAGAQGAMQGYQQANQMQLQRAQLGLIKQKADQAERLQKQYEDVLNDPNTPETVRNALRIGGPEALAKYAESQLPQSVKPTSSMQEYELAKQQGFNGSFLDYETQLKRAGAIRNNTTVKLPTLENEYDKAIGASNAKAYVDVNQQGMNAGNTIAKYQQLGSLLSQPGVYQGAGGETVLQAQKLGASLGLIDDSKVGPAQAAQAISRGLALELRNPASGAGMPGAMSDQDREYLKSLVAGVTNTPEANRLLINAKIKVERRKQQIADLARQYAQQSGGRFDQSGFASYLQQWSSAHPMFSNDPLPPKASTSEGGAPEGVDPGVWQYMTPEERALWRN